MDLLVQRAQIFQRQVRIDGVHHAPDLGDCPAPLHGRPHVEMQPVQLIVLAPRRVIDRWRRTFHAGIVAVPHHADDLDSQLVYGEMNAQGVAPFQEFLHELLVDDRHLRRRAIVALAELAAGDQRNSHLREVAGRDLVHHRVVAVPLVAAFDFQAVAPIVAAEQWHLRQRHAAHAGSRGQVLLRTFEQRPVLLHVVAVERRRNAEADHVLGLHPEVDVQ
jgi:hypothetical protein